MARAAVALASATSKRAGTPNSLRVGTVVSVDATGVQVNVGGGVIYAGLVGGAGAGVAPGATVTVFKQGSSWQVQGAALGGGQALTNSVILPRSLGAAVPGSMVAAVDTAIVTGLNSTFGTFLTSANISVVLPKGHLCQILLSGCSSVATASSFLTVMTIRDNNSASGTVRAAYEQFNPSAGNGSHFDVTGWIVGDGATHSLALCALCLTVGSNLNITRAAGSFFGVIDWGDASGVSIV